MMRAEGIDTVEVDLAPPMMNEAWRRDAEKGGAMPAFRGFT